jgi:broad-specificity NMP kinase
MKHLYIIGGTMGSGKTTVCQRLKQLLPDSVFLDGDWCWDMHPFKVTEETKAMVEGNICFMLNSFLHCSAYENIIFCWVMHRQEIIDSILDRLDTLDCEVKSVSLVLSKEALAERLQCDIDKGIRQPDVIERSIERIPLYALLNTIKIDVSYISPHTAP